MKAGLKPEKDALKLGRFIVKRWLGAGLQGKVFLAFDPDLERHVAIKWLNPGDGTKPDPAAACPSEARIVARMSHPNIVPLYEAGSYRGFPFLVFAYVEGSGCASGTCGRARCLQARHFPFSGPWWTASPTPMRRGYCTWTCRRETS